MAERKLQKQREVPVGETIHAGEGPEEEKTRNSELPRRGTGRKTGTAKTPTGPDDRLTEEERKKRHKRVVG